MCARCGRRVRFNPIQKKGDRRGAVRQALFLAMPNSTRKQIEARATELNRVDRSSRKRGGAGETFVTAQELMKEKITPPVGVPVEPEMSATLLKEWRKMNETFALMGIPAVSKENWMKGGG